MRAAEYVRMSTDFQQYSTVNQQARIREFADAHGHVVVKTYLDEGKSGVSLRGRRGLKELLADVMQGTDEYDAILVYDVSRWGRFQDLDEGAHYEFLCRSAGKRVIYCAEPFEGDGSPYASIVKNLRRIMAREYSRELSDKVFVGQSRLARQGYRVGGAAGFGFRRLVLDQDGRPREMLAHRQRKAQQDFHVVLVPGPAEEVETVREIFRWFVKLHMNYAEIARRLNSSSVVPPPHLKRWTIYVIRRMLTNETYVGCNVYNRTTGRLRQTRTANPESQWIRCENAFEPLVAPALFAAAKRRAETDLRRVDAVRAATKLKALCEKSGRLSVSLMREAGLPDPSTYIKQFGSLKDAFHFAGYDYTLDYARISRQAWATRRFRQQVIKRLRDELAEIGERVALAGEYVLILRSKCKVAVSLFRYDRRGWKFEQPKQVDATLCIRPSPSQCDAEYFLVPSSATPVCNIWAGGGFEDRFGKFRLGRDQIATALIELSRAGGRLVPAGAVDLHLL